MAYPSGHEGRGNHCQYVELAGQFYSLCVRFRLCCLSYLLHLASRMPAGRLTLLFSRTGSENVLNLWIYADRSHKTKRQVIA